MSPADVRNAKMVMSYGHLHVAFKNVNWIYPVALLMRTRSEEVIANKISQEYDMVCNTLRINMMGGGK